MMVTQYMLGGANNSPTMAANNEPVISKPAGAPGQPVTQKLLPKNPKPKQWRPGVNLMEGRQNIKGYSVTHDQLDNLAHTGWLTAVFASMATALFGFTINLKSTLDLSSNASPIILSYWSGINFMTAVGGVVCSILAIIMFLRGSSQKSKIIDNTVFQEEKNDQ